MLDPCFEKIASDQVFETLGFEPGADGTLYYPKNPSMGDYYAAKNCLVAYMYCNGTIAVINNKNKVLDRIFHHKGDFMYPDDYWTALRALEVDMHAASHSSFVDSAIDYWRDEYEIRRVYRLNETSFLLIRGCGKHKRQ